jgi:hypothetical protein
MMPNVHVWSCGVGGVLGGFSFRLRGAVETTTADYTNSSAWLYYFEVL